MSMYGIDISQHNGDIDLTPYKKQFVIIRAGWGTVTDTYFKKNVEKCEKLGIPYGIYWYSYARTVEAVKLESAACLKVISGTPPSVGVWFDMEDADGWKARNGWKKTKSNVSAICNTFCEAIEKAGYYTGIYASYSWFVGSGAVIDCPKYDHWVAHYHTNNGTRSGDYSSMGSIHQYTSKPLDKNYMYGDLSRYAAKKSTTSGSQKKATATADYGYDNLVFGMHHLNITQLGTLIDGQKHLSHPNAALDLAGSDQKVDFYYAKSRMKCIGQWKPGYGTYFFTYVDPDGNYTKMHLADGTDKYVVLAMTHSSQQYVKSVVNKIYEVGSPVYEEGGLGKNGAHTHGNHIHLEVATVDSIADMPKTKAWDQAVGCYRMRHEANPVNCFFILDGFTTVVSTNGAKFKHVSSVKNIKAADTADKEETVYFKPVKLGANVRSAPVNGKVLVTIPKGAKAKVLGFTGAFASDGYEWAKVEYNGTTGYSQLDMKYYVLES